ncbi:MAG: PepSY domain-containing protein [Alphaproteobacteria bacterium]|nr:PepSY domain-containing protein [Alphaproteobacteria bacterium]
MKKAVSNTTILAAAMVSAMSLGVPMAIASDDDSYCSSAPQSEWRTSEDVKAAAEAQGYEVVRVKVEDSCYEVYARGKDGRRTELYFDPVTLKIVKVKDKS